MIRGVHTMIYSKEAEALRAFLRDKLGLSGHDVGEGWLIFDLPEGDMGVHPSDESGDKGAPNGTHDISFYCDDLAATRAELEAKGVEFVSDNQDQGWGIVTRLRAPGDITLMLYQPKYPKGG